MHILNISDSVKKRKRAELAYYIVLFFSAFNLYPLLHTLFYFGQPLLFLSLTGLNLLVIYAARQCLQSIHKYNLKPVLWFAFFTYFLLPFNMAIHLRLQNFPEISHAGLLDIWSYVFQLKSDVEREWLVINNWQLLVICFSVISLFYYEAAYFNYKNRAILSIFNAKQNGKQIRYFSVKGKDHTRLISFFSKAFLLILIILFSIPCLLALIFLAVALRFHEVLPSITDRFAALFTFSRKFYSNTQGYLADNVFAVLDRDPRTPILWIRSFDDDQLEVKGTYGVSLENSVVDTLKIFGPVIAIGCPSAKYRVSGAAREYFKDDEWRTVINNFIQCSGIIVTILGRSAGLEQEYRLIKYASRQNRLFVIIPPVERDEILKRWELFNSIFQFTNNDEFLRLHPENCLLLNCGMDEIEEVVVSTDKSKYAYSLAVRRLKIESELQEERNGKVVLTHVNVLTALDESPLKRLGEQLLLEAEKVQQREESVRLKTNAVKFNVEVPSMDYDIPPLQSEALETLNVLIESYAGSIFASNEKREKIRSLICELSPNRESAMEILSLYQQVTGKNLVTDLTRMNKSYQKISENLDVFIQFDIVEPTFPHKLKG